LRGSDPPCGHGSSGHGVELHHLDRQRYVALWDPASFAEIVDYDTWVAALGDDSRKVQHIEAGAFVPINIQSDGAFGALVRVGQSINLTEREAQYVLVTSEPYLFVSSGRAWISGIERVGGPDEHDGLEVAVAPGRWIATVHVLDWNAEPGSVGQDRRPVPNQPSDLRLR
jgi:hypothetical protein